MEPSQLPQSRGSTRHPRHTKEKLRLFSSLEIAVFNHYFKTLDYVKTSRALKITEKHCVFTLKRVFKKFREFFIIYSSIERDVNISLLPPGSNLDQPLELLGLSTRLCHVLKEGGCETLRDVVRLQESELKRFRRMGKISIVELKDKLAKKGLSHLGR